MPVNIEQALDLRINNGLSYNRIAAIQGVTPPAVLNKIKHLLPAAETDIYKTQRADIFSHAQLRILSSITASDLKKAPLQAKVVSAGILYDKERLERGLSTERIDHVVLSAKLSDLQAEEERLDRLIKAKSKSCNPTETSQVVDMTKDDP